MAEADFQTDLPSPTHRDSAASAIFNLYGYSSRNSSHSHGTFGAFQQGYGGVENGNRRSHVEHPAEDEGDGLVEELRSPKMEGFEEQPRLLETAPQDSPRRLSNGNDHQIPNDTMYALCPPIADTIPSPGRQPLESPDKYRTSSINRPQSITDQQSVSSAQERETRNRRRSSGASAASASRILAPTADPIHAKPSRLEIEVSPVQPDSHLDLPYNRESEADAIARRQPGEEEDAYHVRSTCKHSFPMFHPH
jgi:hypothetical protein